MRFCFAFAILSILCIPAYAQDDDKYKKPGHTGDLPTDAEESGVGKTFNIDRDQPKPLSCDTRYFFRAVSHASVGNCAGYNFRALYYQASDAAEKRAQEMECKSGPESECKTLVTWRAWHSWTCANGNADAVVVFGAACPKNPGTFAKTPSVKRPKPADLMAPNGPPPASQPGTTENIDITGGPDPVGCTPPKIEKYQYKYAINPQPADFEPYVKDAVKLAEAYAGTIKCAKPCKKQPFHADRTEWSYDGTYVVVDVYFVACK